MPTATVCASPYQKASCAKSVMQNSPPAYCKAQDEKLLDNVSSMSLKYYDGETALDANSAASANNVSVTLSSSIKSAGDTIAYDGSVRIKTVNDDADVGDTPRTPVTAGSVDTKNDPGTYTCSWESVGGATGYTVKYSFDGGTTWTSSDTDKDTLSTTVDISAKPNQTITCQAFARTASGDISYKPTSYNIPQFNACNFQNGWQNYGGSVYGNVGFRKSSQNVVTLTGLATGGTSSAYTTVCTLPEKYRPDSRLIFVTSTSGGQARVDIETNGNVLIVRGSSSYLSFAGINFVAAGSSWETTTGANSWTNYGSPYSDVKVRKDSSGRAFIQGLAKGGTTTANTTAFTLPSGYAVSKPGIFPASGGSDGSGQTQNNNSIAYRGGSGNGYWSLQNIFYPGSTAGPDGMKTASLQNGWATYSTGYGPAQYTKNSDGIVSLRGLIKGGSTTNGSVIFNLPAGYRPASRLICNGVTYPDKDTRYDIDANGNVLVVSGVSSTWLSLDGCDFVAEQ